MRRLVVASGTFENADIENEVAGDRAQARLATIATAEQVARETADADAVIVTTNPLDAELVAALGPKVRIIGRAGIGLDAIDLAACGRAGIAVVNQPDYATAEVATHALAMLLGLQRRLLDGDRIARRDWPAFPSLYDIRPLHELTLGLVGTGRIGRAVAERARPLVREIRAYDPYAGSVEGIELDDSLEQLLASSDIVSLHTPLTPETRYLVDAARLAQMRPGALLVNVSRGGLIDPVALAAALDAGAIAGAALDVFDQEPLAPDDPLARSPRTLLSPHIAWFSTGSVVRVRANTLEDVLGYLDRGEIAHGTLIRPA
jgi:D-3-phosphoglycerate dehydrogenase